MRTRDLTGLGVCWLGNMRYTQPLSLTDDRKWRLLAGLGMRMYIIGFSADRRPRQFTCHARFYLLPELPLAPLRYLEFVLIAPLLMLWLVFRRNVRVLVASSPYEGALGALVKQAARLVGRRVALVVESHGDYEVSVFMQRQVRLAGLYRWLMRRAVAVAFYHADAFRAISGMTARQLQPHVRGRPFQQFMTWTDAAVFRDTPREIPITHTQDVVYAGVLIPRKGVHVLLEAFAAIAEDVPNATLWLVGKAENTEYAAQLAEQAQRLELAGRVQFVGAVPQRELAAYFGRCRVKVLPSLSEGLGRVLLEAMLCGTPCIGSRVDGIPDLVKDGITGYLVPPEDPAALSQALLKALTDPDPDAMSDRARTFARSFFSETAYVEGYERLLSQAAARVIR